MGNPFENTPGNKKEKSSQKNHFDTIKIAIENRIGKKLPEDKEDLFRNFDKLVPKEVDHINVIDKVRQEDQHGSLYRYTREGIKSSLERELYGATMKDVDDYFRNEIESIEQELEKTQRSRDLGYKKDFDPKLLVRHDKYVDLFNQISTGAVGNPLAEIELQINSNFTNESKKDNLKKLAERLSAEVYKDKPKNEVLLEDIKKTFSENEQWFIRDVIIDKDNKEYNKKHYRKVFEDFDKGNMDSALEEVDFSIGWIQSILEDRKNKDLKKVVEESLKERYGENFMYAVTRELEKLRTYRKFLFNEQKKSEKPFDTKEKTASRSSEQPVKPKEQGKEKLEGEKLFQYQIENNSHPNAEGLQGDIIFFIKSVDKGISKPEDFQDLKDELSEVLYRCGVEYVEGKETKIDGKDKEILQPVLDFRKEMDSWNTLSETRITDFRKRLVGYIDDVFGIETQEPREGEKYDSKKMQATKTEDTKNEFLNDKIKKVYSPEFKINEKLFDYYTKWLTEREREMRKKREEIKNSVSREEFDKIADQDQGWLIQHRFAKSIKSAQVEIYKFQA